MIHEHIQQTVLSKLWKLKHLCLQVWHRGSVEQKLWLVYRKEAPSLGKGFHALRTVSWFNCKHCHDTRTKTAWNGRAFPGLGKHLKRVMQSQTKIHLPSPPKCRLLNTYSYIYVGLASRCLERLKGDRCQAETSTLSPEFWLQTYFCLLVLKIC